MTLCQCDKLQTLAQKKRIVGDEYSADSSLGKQCKCLFEVIKVARHGDFHGAPGRTCNIFDFLQDVLIVRVYQKTDGRVLWEKLPDKFKTFEGTANSRGTLKMSKQPIGPGRTPPPAEHRFLKGSCGNKRGRPKGTVSLKKLTRKVALKKHHVVVEGRVLHKTLLALVIGAMIG